MEAKKRKRKKPDHALTLAKLKKFRKANKQSGSTRVVDGLKATPLDVSRSSVENLKTQLDVTYSMLKKAEKNYHKYPTDRNCYAVAKLIETASYLLTAIEEKRDPNDVIAQLNEVVLQAVFKDVIATVSDHVRFLRDSLFEIKSKKEIPGICENFMRSVGESLNEVYAESSERLDSVVKDIL